MDSERWRQIEELYHGALALARDSRQEYLLEACGDDAELRREIESLLCLDEQVGSFLEPRETEISAICTPMAGRQLGPYQVLEQLGAGGMGEVYRARDTKLDREVALKVLRPAFAGNPERLARFRREARTLAALNHPNIAMIYGLEEFDGGTCLVLELVEGETLRGPLSVEKALDYAQQIANAVEAAHEKGVIHRDLKPSNVKVTPEGKVKVLDFGLAKAASGTNESLDLTQAIAIGHTLSGQIVGTPSYMSPEQARGEAVNQRTDIWAFGCVLYELLTGKQAFSGTTLSETIRLVLECEPDWSALPAKTPVKIRKLLRRCLVKYPAARLQNIRNVREEIGRAQRGFSRWQLAGALLVCAWIGWHVVPVVAGRQSPTRPPIRSEWVQLTNLTDPVSQPALSPDGRMVAFVRSSSTYFALGQLFVKALPDGELVQLTHDTLRKMSPAFSPDGTHIAYTTVDTQFDRDTWIVPTEGGTPRPWLQNAIGLTWIGPRQVLFSGKLSSGRRAIVTAKEGRLDERNVYVPMHDRGMTQRSQASPDGKWVLLAEITGYGNWGPCRVVPMTGGSQGIQVGPPDADCTFGAWSPDGKWIYLTSKAGGLFHIWRQRFPDGRPEQFTSGQTEEEGIAIAPDGLSIVTAVGLQSSSIWVHDSTGDRQISRLEGNAAYPKFTPDGKKVCYRIVKSVPVFGTLRDPGEVWVADLVSGHTEPLAPGFQPLDFDISNDGKQVVMEAPDREGRPRLWVTLLDGRSTPRQIPGVEGRNANFGPGGEVFFRRTEALTAFLYRVWPDGTGLRKALEQPVLHLSGFSPDDRWMQVWATLPGGQSAKLMVPMDGGSPVVIGGSLLQWSSSGDTVWISAGAVPDGRSYIVPLPPGKALPSIPAGGFRSEEQIARLPGARMIEYTGAPGPTRDVYAFERRTVQRNLYRIPIP